MKLKELQSMLQDIQDFDSPKQKLEQYITRPEVAAGVLFAVRVLHSQAFSADTASSSAMHACITVHCLPAISLQGATNGLCLTCAAQRHPSSNRRQRGGRLGLWHCALPRPVSGMQHVVDTVIMLPTPCMHLAPQPSLHRVLCTTFDLVSGNRVKRGTPTNSCCMDSGYAEHRLRLAGRGTCHWHRHRCGRAGNCEHQYGRV